MGKAWDKKSIYMCCGPSFAIGDTAQYKWCNLCMLVSLPTEYKD